MNSKPMRPGLPWALPAIAALASLALLLAWWGDSPARAALWPTHHVAFLTLNRQLAFLPQSIWWGLTLLGDTSVLMLLLAPLLTWRPRAWAAIVASVPAGALFSVLVKNLASVPRPAAVLADFNLIGPALHSNSFPSGHSITAFAAAAAVLAVTVPEPRRIVQWTILGAGVLVALMISMSRLAVGAHWPLDLVAGAAGGWLAGLSGVLLTRRTGWWQWLFVGRGRRAAGAGLVVWGVALWLRAHETAACAVVLGTAGFFGILTGLNLLASKGASPGQVSADGSDTKAS